MAKSTAVRGHGIPAVPSDFPVQHRAFFTAMRNAVIKAQGSLAPPSAPSNPKAVPVAGGIQVQFTRGSGDHHIVYSSPTPNFDDAIAHPVGQAQIFDHTLGNAGVKQNYWIQGFTAAGAKSDLVGPVSAASLGLNTGTTIPSPPIPVNPPLGTDPQGHEIQIKQEEIL